MEKLPPSGAWVQLKVGEVLPLVVLVVVLVLEFPWFPEGTITRTTTRTNQTHFSSHLRVLTPRLRRLLPQQLPQNPTHNQTGTIKRQVEQDAVPDAIGFLPHITLNG